MQKIIDAIFSHIVALLGYFYFTVVCKGKIYNEKDLLKIVKSKTRFIVALNHESYLDWIVVWSIFRYKYKISIVFLAKEKLFQHKIWGRVVRYSNCIKVTDNGTKIIDQDAKIKMESSVIGIFPEGTRTRTGQLSDFKPGVAFIAKKLKRSILPLSLNNFYEAWTPRASFPTIKKLNIVVGREIKYSPNLGIREYLKIVRYQIKLGKDINTLKTNDFKIAIFDLDSTLTKTNIAELLFYIKKKNLSRYKYYLWLSSMIPLVPILKFTDKFYRPLVQLVIYNFYLRLSDHEILSNANEFIEVFLDERLIPRTVSILKNLRENNVDIVIVSSNLDAIVKPIARYFKVDYTGINLLYYRTLKFKEKLSYLANFKNKELNRINTEKSLGIGDSKYDKPIFNAVNYSILVYSGNVSNNLSKEVQHSIKID